MNHATHCAGAEAGSCSSAAWPKAKLNRQTALALSGLLFIRSGYKTLSKNERKWMPLWLAGLLGWAIIPKFFICTRCENYGKPCDFFYGGKYAKLLFKDQPEKRFNAAGYLAEGLTLAVFQLMPAIAARRDGRALLRYLASGLTFQCVLIIICCVGCVRNAQDPWKRKYCPTYKLTEFLLKTFM